MKWEYTAFKFKRIADLTKNELDKAGINTGHVFHTGQGYWFVPWKLKSKEQEQKALHIVAEYILRGGL